MTSVRNDLPWEELTDEHVREFAAECRTAAEEGLPPLEAPAELRADSRSASRSNARTKSKARSGGKLPDLRGEGTPESNEVHPVRTEELEHGGTPEVCPEAPRADVPMTTLIAEAVAAAMDVHWAGLHERIDVLERRIAKMEAKKK